jgi:hypothetical protein
MHLTSAANRQVWQGLTQLLNWTLLGEFSKGSDGHQAEQDMTFGVWDLRDSFLP